MRPAAAGASCQLSSEATIANNPDMIQLHEGGLYLFRSVRMAVGDISLRQSFPALLLLQVAQSYCLALCSLLDWPITKLSWQRWALRLQHNIILIVPSDGVCLPPDLACLNSEALQRIAQEDSLSLRVQAASNSCKT